MTTGRSRAANDDPAAACLAAATALAPQLAAAAPAIEAARELTPGVVEALHEAGLFRMLLPRAIGGWELAPADYVRAIEQLAKADASTAWCVAQLSVCSTAAASLEPAAAREIFGAERRGLMAWGPPSAGARALAADGGYRVSGQWHFASGSRHAAWLGAHCPVFEADGTPRITADGAPVERTVIFAKADARVTDPWHVMGLKGTGSDSYAVSELFVPQRHTVSAFGRNLAEKHEKGPLYHFTVFQLFGASFAAIALGIARAAQDAFIELAKAKTPYGGRPPLRENAVIQSTIGLSEAKLASARSFLLTALDDMWRGAASGGVSVDQRIALRMASSLATQHAKDAVDAAYHAAGATAIFESNPFERRFRDVHTVSQQVQAHFAVFESIGQHFLGFPLHPRLI